MWRRNLLLSGAYSCWQVTELHQTSGFCNLTQGGWSRVLIFKLSCKTFIMVPQKPSPWVGRDRPPSLTPESFRPFLIWLSNTLTLYNYLWTLLSRLWECPCAHLITSSVWCDKHGWVGLYSFPPRSNSRSSVFLVWQKTVTGHAVETCAWLCLDIILCKLYWSVNTIL